MTFRTSRLDEVRKLRTKAGRINPSSFFAWGNMQMGNHKFIITYYLGVSLCMFPHTNWGRSIFISQSLFYAGTTGRKN
jgi:hypothetical protein